ncbi:MAG: tautomerase family protein [Pseudonocardia sp.]|nr:tautomerase family protein [Pseudonocardia sp.]MBO0875271.1 tautomerase family protein [Pseudonocardia sp.]
MPIVTFHLVEGQYSIERIHGLLTDASAMLARVQGCKPDHVRAFVRLYQPELVAVGGDLVSRTGRRAPYFEFTMPAGGPARQRRVLLAGFTDLLVDILGAPREAIRGRAVPVDPNDWTGCR